MQLTLRILTYRNAPVPAAPAVRFDSAGGNIGRSGDNALVLDDPSKYISRVHARVFAQDGAFVLESRAYAADENDCTSATQSGPMLVIDGDLHPRFIPDSDSRYIRNGVGTSEDGSRAVFAISRRAVNFYDFARFFRDGLGLPDALYFDGNVSRLHAPALGRSDFGRPMGPIVGLLEQDARPD